MPPLPCRIYSGFPSRFHPLSSIRVNRDNVGLMSKGKSGDTRKNLRMAIAATGGTLLLLVAGYFAGPPILNVIGRSIKIPAISVRFHKVALLIDPRSADAWNGIGTWYCLNRNFPEGKRHFEAALKFNPNNARATYNMAMICLINRDSDKAEQYARKTIELTPNDPDAYVRLGEVFAERCECDAAFAMYQKADKIRPGNPDIFGKMGDAFFRKRDFRKAVEYYNKAIALAPKDFVYQAQKAEALQSLGRFKEALSSIEVAARLAPKDSVVAYLRHSIKVNLGLIPADTPPPPVTDNDKMVIEKQQKVSGLDI